MKKKAALTRWFSIDDDGQPTLPGWYQTLYAGDSEDTDEFSWWDGTKWRWDFDGGQLAFGNWGTKGERWRGLASDPSKAGSKA